MTDKSAELVLNENIFLFTLYRIISRLYFHLPIFFLYLFTLELGIYWIIFLFIVYGLSTTFTGSLTKKIINKFSAKQSVAIGESLKCVSLVILLMGTQQGNVSLFMVFISQFIGGTGFIIALTTDTGLLHNITSVKEGLFVSIQGRTQSKMFVATLVAGFIGTLLYDYQPNWPFISSTIASASSIIFILLIDDSTIKQTLAKTEKTSTPIAEINIKQKQLLWSYFYSISRSFTMAPFIAFFPYFFISVNVEPLLFGLVLSLFTLAAYGTSMYSNTLIKMLGIFNVLIGIVIFMLTSFLMIAISPLLATKYGIDYFISGLISITLLGLGSGAIRPITMVNLDLKDLTPPSQIYISTLMEKNFGIINGLLLAFGSYILVNVTIQSLMFCMGISYLLAMSLLIASYFSNILGDTYE